MSLWQEIKEAFKVPDVPCKACKEVMREILVKNTTFYVCPNFRCNRYLMVMIDEKELDQYE